MEGIGILHILALPVFGYALGSVPFGLWLTWLFCGLDIRKTGSGNIGATNVRRTAGNTLGALTLMADAAKGMVPVWIAASWVQESTPLTDMYIGTVGLSAFMGHLYPLFFKGKGGGKGVATALGCYLIITPSAALVTLLIFILAVCITSRVSAASLAASLLLPLCVWKATGSPALTACAVITAVWIVIRHGENIKRLFRGQEPRI